MENKEVNRLHLVHLGKILCNFCILGGIFMLLYIGLPAGAIGLAIIGGVLFIFAFAVDMFTFFQAGAIHWVIDSFFSGSGEIIGGLLYGMSVALPYVFGVTFVLAAAGITLIAVFDDYKRRGRIAVASVCVGLGLIAFIVYAVYGHVFASVTG